MDIKLRHWEENDGEALAAVFNDLDRSFLSNRLPDPYTLEDAVSWLKMVNERDGQNGVYRAIMADGEIVGAVSVEKKEDVFCRDGEISYNLMTRQQSRGIMTEAVRQICETAFMNLDIVRITGLVYEPNVGSRKVLEKNGFSLEGIMRKAVSKNGVLLDLFVYGKLR